MILKTEYKTISSRSKSLLDREEGHDAEFKKSLGQLEPGDLVSFANSEHGGAMLIGVEEIKTAKGQQKGKVVGCQIGDREKLAILSRAQSCIPPVEIKIIVENSGHVPFYRIEIPSGRYKPYCTSGGTYKIRGDGRSNPLLPNELKRIILEVEYHLFVEKFKEATKELDNNLLDTKQKTEDELRKLLGFIESMNYEISEGLSHISESAENAEGLSDEARTYSDTTAEMTEELIAKVEEIENYPLYEIKKEVDALLEYFSIEHPLSKEARLIIEKQTKNLFEAGLQEEEVIHEICKKWEDGGIWADQVSIIQWCVKRYRELKNGEKDKPLFKED